MFAARLVAYVPDGARLGALPDPLDFSAMTAHDDRGSLTVTYSSLATAGVHVERGLDDGLEVAVEAWNGTAWVEPRGCRFALLSRNRDSIDPSKTVSLTLPSWAWLLGQARILEGPFYGPEHAQAGKRGFEAKTVGDILLTLLNENAARDGVPVTATFTAVNDSEGNPWPVLPNQAFEAGADLGAVLDTLTQAGACDWWTQARGLYAVLPDSATAFPVLPATLRATDVSGAPDTETLEGTLGRLMLRTQAGGTVTVDDPAAPAPFGVWEGFTQAGNLADEAAATALAEQTLEGSAKVRGQFTRELTLTDTSPRPLIDYWPGAWMTAPVDGTQQSVRVQSVTLSLSGGQIGGNVVLNDRLTDADLRRARTLASLAGGGSISPSGPPTAVDPEASRVPTTPTGLANATALTFTGPTPRGVVTPSWNVVTTATDLGTLTISGYELQWRIGAGAWQTILTPELSAQIPDLTPGDAGTTRVRTIGARTTLPSAWSSTVAFTVPGDVTAPSTPTGLTLASALKIVSATWAGTPTMPADFAYVEVYVGSTSTPTTARGRLLGAGTLQITGETIGATRWVRLRAFDTTGNASAYSTAVSVVVTGVTGPDLEANSVTANTIAVGALDGKIITGSTIRTSATNPRVEMDSTGLYAYNGAGTVTVSIVSGTATITGGTIRTAVSGDRLEMTTTGLRAWSSGSAVVEILPTGVTINDGGKLVVEFADSSPALLVGDLGSDRFGVEMYRATDGVDVFTLSTNKVTGNVLLTMDGLNTWTVFTQVASITASSSYIVLGGGTSGDNIGYLTAGPSGAKIQAKNNDLTNEAQVSVAPGLATLKFPGTTASTSRRVKIDDDDSTIADWDSAGMHLYQASSIPGDTLVRRSSDSRIGFQSSSLRWKQDVEDHDLDLTALLSLRVRSWRDTGEVAENPETTSRYVGFIAEEVDALGLTEAVLYDSEGPRNLHERAFLAGLIQLAQNHESRLAALEAA